MKNQVIKVLNKEHGKKVIEYWKSRGVNTGCHEGFMTEADGLKHIYYGVIDGKWNNYKFNCLKDAEIIELPKEELPLPRMVMVRNEDDQEWEKLNLMYEFPERFSKQARYIVELDNNIWTSFNQMKEIELVQEMTLEEVCKELGRNIKIVK